MSWWRQLPTAVFLMGFSMSLSAPSLFAVDCSVPTPGLSVSLGSIFNLNVSGFISSDVTTAINYWSCPGYGSKIPSFQIGGSGGIPVLVAKIVGNAPPDLAGCGFFEPDTPRGYIESATITVWTKDRTGQPCPVLLTDVLAHELGHLMGLANAPGLECAGRIMGAPLSAPYTRTVYADDCAVADDQWQTPSENEPDNPWCDAYCWTDCVNGQCPLGAPSCPLLIDMENDGIHLTGLDNPVWFDIDADGEIELMSWTDHGEGLLALDRNGNGSIDDGGELFGDSTVLADGTRAANGYLALAELDSGSFGGNGNGRIDPGDFAFVSLRLWRDRDHSGTSRPDELHTLAEAGIQQIGLEYRSSRRRDRYGNEFRYLGRAWKTGPFGIVRPILTWDVFFLVAPHL
jgi:hypothetical protein